MTQKEETPLDLAIREWEGATGLQIPPKGELTRHWSAPDGSQEIFVITVPHEADLVTGSGTSWWHPEQLGDGALLDALKPVSLSAQEAAQEDLPMGEDDLGEEDGLGEWPEEGELEDSAGNSAGWAKGDLWHVPAKARKGVLKPKLVKVGQEGFIHGYICVRPPCGGPGDPDVGITDPAAIQAALMHLQMKTADKLREGDVLALPEAGKPNGKAYFRVQKNPAPAPGQPGWVQMQLREFGVDGKPDPGGREIAPSVNAKEMIDQARPRASYQPVQVDKDKRMVYHANGEHIGGYYAQRGAGNWRAYSIDPKLGRVPLKRVYGSREEAIQAVAHFHNLKLLEREAHKRGERGAWMDLLAAGRAFENGSQTLALGRLDSAANAVQNDPALRSHIESLREGIARPFEGPKPRVRPRPAPAPAPARAAAPPAAAPAPAAPPAPAPAGREVPLPEAMKMLAARMRALADRAGNLGDARAANTLRAAALGAEQGNHAAVDRRLQRAAGHAQNAEVVQEIQGLQHAAAGLAARAARAAAQGAQGPLIDRIKEAANVMRREGGEGLAVGALDAAARAAQMGNAVGVADHLRRAAAFAFGGGAQQRIGDLQNALAAEGLGAPAAVAAPAVPGVPAPEPPEVQAARAKRDAAIAAAHRIFQQAQDPAEQEMNRAVQDANARRDAAVAAAEGAEQAARARRDRANARQDLARRNAENAALLLNNANRELDANVPSNQAILQQLRDNNHAAQQMLVDANAAQQNAKDARRHAAPERQAAIRRAEDVRDVAVAQAEDKLRQVRIPLAAVRDQAVANARAEAKAAGVEDRGVTAQPAFVAGAQALRDGIGAGLQQEKRPDVNGAIGDNMIVTFKNGMRAFRKRDKRGSPEDADREYLGALLGRVLKLGSPVTIRTGPGEIHAELVLNPAGVPQVGNELDWAPRNQITKSDRWRRMGVMDNMIYNTDRHDGNWMVGHDGGVVPIDHGFAFFRHGTPAIDAMPSRGPGATATNLEFTKEQYMEWRQQIQELEAEFRALNHMDWYNEMMRRYDYMMNKYGK